MTIALSRKQSRHGITVAISVAVVLSFAACGETTATPSDGHVPLGTWGANNAGVLATDSITHIHVGCTFGDVPGRVALDADGRFSVSGTYVLRAYPVMIGPELPAQFSGSVRGNVLTVSVAVNDTVEKQQVTLGPVTVVLGVTPNMGPCPICSVPRVLGEKR